jgi:hypothetical protein
MHRADLTDIDGVKLDPGERAAIVKSRDIGKPAAETVQCLDDDHIKDAPIETAQQPLVLRPEARGALRAASA